MNLETTEALTQSKAGRPTRERATIRHAALLDCALEHFLEKGFEQATIEAISAKMAMTKRTVYARFADKASLFRAAVDRAIDRYQVRSEEIAATETDDVEQTLFNIAMLRINRAASPEGMKLQRIIQTESYRFPEIFTAAYEIAAKATIDFLADFLDRRTAAGDLQVGDANMAAHLFMGMAVSGPVRVILSGTTWPEGELDRRVRSAVRLFLSGTLPR
jgi:AcrR family transcriptional regulator